jgi:EAL domain-containing protein (putative c-di-GMP-specific phosphodiesterase class I)
VPVSLTVAVAARDFGSIEAAAACLQRFYPDVTIKLDGEMVSLASETVPAEQLRSAWLCHLHEAKSRAQRLDARDRLIRELFL